MISVQNGKNLIQHKINKVFHSSTGKGWTCCITDWLKKAKTSIKIISPVIESEVIFKELNDANQRGVYLQVVTSLLDRNGKIKSAGDKQFSALQLPGQKLAVLGASVRATQNIPHAKIIIIDDAIVLFMSANLSDNSLGIGKVNAVETCIILRDTSIVSSCRILFAGIWDSTQFIQGTDKNGLFIAQKAGKNLSELPYSLNGKEEYLIFSCPQNLALGKAIVMAIKEAKSEVVLMAMSFYDMDQVPDLYNTLSELLSKKVSIKLLVRPGSEQFAKSEWPDKSTKRLLDAGMQLMEIPHLHAKGVIVDGNTVLAMSANFNPFSLGSTKTSHIECGLLALTETSWAKQFIAFTRQLIKKEGV